MHLAPPPPKNTGLAFVVHGQRCQRCVQAKSTGLVHEVGNNFALCPGWRCSPLVAPSAVGPHSFPEKRFFFVQALGVGKALLAESVLGVRNQSSPVLRLSHSSAW